MDSNPGTFLQVNPFAQLTLANACGGVVPAGTVPPPLIQAEDLQADPALHQRLVQHLLRNPAGRVPPIEGGIAPDTLVRDLTELLEGADPLRNLFKPCAAELRGHAAAMPLHPVVRLLLTAGRAITPGSYAHALRAMALAGALAWHAKASASFMQRAMLVGLLHDLGEIYVNPEYLRAGRQLDLREYRQLAAHPHIGSLLLSELTDYPAEITRAVCEHHERLDGTGYPFQQLGAAISPLGQLMAVAELVLGIADQRAAAPARASFALKFVPGEVAGPWAGPITRWADTEPPAEPPEPLDEAMLAQLGSLDAALQRMEQQAKSIADKVDGASQRVALRAAHRLHRLRMAWNAMGLWSLPESEIEPRERFEIALAMRELRYRINTIGRDSLWPETDEAVLADARLVPLWLTLASAGQAPR
ncbi:MAG: HD domain-containing protein [Burkholderiales bacterium]|nr:HD domain-containing protein [Burkholderiales bacterium]